MFAAVLHEPKKLLIDELDAPQPQAGQVQIRVRAGVPVEIEDVTMRASFAVAAGERVGFSLCWIPTEAHEPPAAVDWVRP